MLWQSVRDNYIYYIDNSMKITMDAWTWLYVDFHFRVFDFEDEPFQYFVERKICPADF